MCIRDRAQEAANTGGDKLNGWAVIDNETVRTTGVDDPQFISATTFEFNAPDGITANGVPLPVYGGCVTLGASPIWVGSTGVAVSQSSAGVYVVSFPTAFANASEYHVQATLTDTWGDRSFVTAFRDTSDEFSITIRDNAGAYLDIGAVTLLIYKFV